MNVQPIKPYSTNNKQSFGAKPVGYARELLIKALTNAKLEGQINDVTAHNSILELASIAKHFYGVSEPLEIRAQDSLHTYGFFYVDKYRKNLIPFIEIPKEVLINQPCKFIKDIVSNLRKTSAVQDSKSFCERIESELFLDKIFGK